MIVTCVVHHPDRPEECVLRAILSLTKATKKKHLIDLRIQGEDPNDIVTKAQRIVKQSTASPVGLVSTVYSENRGQTLPLIDSVGLAKRRKAKWWAKLDDDAVVPDDAWDLLIEAIECVGPLAACAQANPRHIGPRILKETMAGIRVVEGFLDEGSIEARSAWHVVEVVGAGCSVFRREVFDTCSWDARFEVSEDIDLAMQLKQMGYVALLCDPPRADHYHRECSPEKYDRIRYDHGKVLRTKDAFLRKWGQPCCYFNKLKRRFG